MVQRQVLYLGELNDNQRAGWVRTIEAFSGEKSKSKQLALFPDDREELPAMDCETIRVQLDKIELRNPREWGSVLVGIVFVGSAGEDYSLAQKDKPYRCLDLLLKHRDELFEFLKGQWSNLFGAKYDVLLYDLTSTYFESNPPAAGSESKKFWIQPGQTFGLCSSGRGIGVDAGRFSRGLRGISWKYQRYCNLGGVSGSYRETVWETYLLLTRIEQAFKDLKGELSIRPIWHQLEKRIEAHIFVSFPHFHEDMSGLLSPHNVAKSCTGTSRRSHIRRNPRMNLSGTVEHSND